MSGQSLTYDANGNLISDGQREYSWDAEDRLIEITYPGEPGKQTEFVYDGLDRRTAVIRTPPGGGSAVTTSYIWCGTRICQARDGSNTPTRSYVDEGEYVPGSPGQTYYYAPDQIGSVRRVFESASVAPAYDYDPWGNLLQVTPPPTDFGFAGMLAEPDSGLYLTQYRAYDPVAGRWISRDPLGEMIEIASSMMSGDAGFPSDAIAQQQSAAAIFQIAENNSYDFTNETNLYEYVKSNPISGVDPNGLELKLLGPGGGGRICGVIYCGYGVRLDYAPNPGPTLLHLHAGPLSAGGDWGGHRPWYAPWRTY